MYGFEDYKVALILRDVHDPIASWSYPTVFAIVILGIISYSLIRIKKLKLPPLLIVGAMSGVFICSVYIIIFIIQLSNNMQELDILYLIIFPINCSIRAEIEIMKKYNL